MQAHGTYYREYFHKFHDSLLVSTNLKIKHVKEKRSIFYCVTLKP